MGKIRQKLKETIDKFEYSIREFITAELKNYYGENWWDICIDSLIKKEVERLINKENKKEPNKIYDKIEYLTFFQYKTIITDKNNWNNLFKNYFLINSNFTFPFDKIRNIRNRISHLRFYKNDLKKLEVYSDEILRLVPNKYIKTKKPNINDFLQQGKKQIKEKKLYNQILRIYSSVFSSIFMIRYYLIDYSYLIYWVIYTTLFILLISILLKENEGRKKLIKKRHLSLFRNFGLFIEKGVINDEEFEHFLLKWYKKAKHSRTKRIDIIPIYILYYGVIILIISAEIYFYVLTSIFDNFPGELYLNVFNILLLFFLIGFIYLFFKSYGENIINRYYWLLKDIIREEYFNIDEDFNKIFNQYEIKKDFSKLNDLLKDLIVRINNLVELKILYTIKDVRYDYNLQVFTKMFQRGNIFDIFKIIEKFESEINILKELNANEMLNFNGIINTFKLLKKKIGLK